jgi:phenylalanyl-tRNA synthetase beta chain
MDGNRLLVQTPPHRLDIGTGVTGKADIIEEIARMVGYDQILQPGFPPPCRRSAAMLHWSARKNCGTFWQDWVCRK